MEQALVADDQPRRIAVFDFDGTSISGQSGSLFTRYLLRRGYLNPFRMLRLMWWGIRYVTHMPLNQNEPREVLFAALDEHTPEEVHQVMVDFHDQVLAKRYRPSAIDEIARRKAEGCVTLLVSATFRDIAEAAAKRLGVDDFIATEMETDETGDYTGRVEGGVIAGPEKTRAVERWANERLGEGNWVIAYSYADHHTDTDLLQASQEAFAVSPGKTLKYAAKKRNWEILKWR